MGLKHLVSSKNNLESILYFADNCQSKACLCPWNSTKFHVSSHNTLPSTLTRSCFPHKSYLHPTLWSNHLGCLLLPVSMKHFLIKFLPPSQDVHFYFITHLVLSFTLKSHVNGILLMWIWEGEQLRNLWFLCEWTGLILLPNRGRIWLNTYSERDYCSCTHATKFINSII